MGTDPKGKSVRTPSLTFLYCSEWLHQFLAHASDWFCNVSGRERVELPKGRERVGLPKGAQHKWRNHPKLTQRVF